jgi:hypothetical protein
MTQKYGWTLRRKPFAPRFMLKSLATLKEVHPEWEYYLNTAKA